MQRVDFLKTTGAASLAAMAPAPFSATKNGSVAVRDGRFVIGGRPTQIVSGEMHYVRIPPEYWSARLRMARAMGLNCITTYVFWNVHEPSPGTYDFRGARDVAQYVRLAQAEGLHVILRPGPYVCSEWDFGGFPAWLLKDPLLVARSDDERFLSAARRWLNRLGAELAPLQYARGGPIIAAQVENEYGSFGSDHRYMQSIRQAIVEAGFDSVALYTADGADELPNGTLSDLPCVANFGTGDAADELPKLRRFDASRNAPALNMCGEYWDGWFDHWGEPHNVTDGNIQTAELDSMLSGGYSVSLYMFHGGTNFAGMNGANYDRGAPYQPTTTSYDYDAPLDEAGRPRDKYFRFRSIVVKRLGAPAPDVPSSPETIEISEFALNEHADWRALLGIPVHTERPQYMEFYDQAYGSILYRTTLASGGEGSLQFGDVRDYAVVFVDGERAGDLDRRSGQRALPISARAGSVLEVLVENTGRINYGKDFINDRKGIIAPVTLNGREITGWSAFTLPMADLAALQFSGRDSGGIAFHRGTFQLSQPGDTFLDARMLGKGLLWINGHNAGRFWSAGPQFTLYVPASFLRQGENTVVAFDLFERSERRMSGLREPVYAPIEE